MRILVFGAGGYIGVPLCEALAQAGHTVGATDRWFFGKRPSGIQTYTADIRTVNGGFFADGTGRPVWDAVVDLAGLSNDATAEMDPQLTRGINWQGGERVARLAAEAGVSRYVYSSSAAVYGQGKNMGLTEESELLPLTQYAHSKVRVEDCIRQIEARHPTFKAVILRNATVFGVAPRMRFDLAVNVMTMRAWREKLIYVMGGGAQWRPFVHISDVVKVFKMFVENNVIGTFNVGADGNQHTVRELAGMVKDQVPDAVIHTIPDDPDHRSYHLSFKKLAATGFMTTRTVRSGIEEVLSALSNKVVDPSDPTAYTLQYYRTLMEWDRKLAGLRLDGRLL